MIRAQLALEASLRRAGERLLVDMHACRRRGKEAASLELGRIIRRVPYAVLIADDQQRYVDVNAAACRLLGFNRPELLRLRVADVVADDRYASTQRRWQTFIQERTQEGELPLKRRDSNIIVASYWACVNIVPGVHISVLAQSIGEILETAPKPTRKQSR